MLFSSFVPGPFHYENGLANEPFTTETSSAIQKATDALCQSIRCLNCSYNDGLLPWKTIRQLGLPRMMAMLQDLLRKYVFKESLPATIVYQAEQKSTE